MNTSSGIWFAFGQTFAMLFLVLALLIFVFYLTKKLSVSRGAKGGKNIINIMAIHHLSPKEKLVLIDVLGQTLLVGVTSGQISKIADFGSTPEISGEPTRDRSRFAQFLNRKMGRTLKDGSDET
mgnify:CR=1 FL=1